MNYIWDMAIKAARQNIPSATITFLPGKSCSPYMELAFEDINTSLLDQQPAIEINPYYRFCDIFKKLLDINFLGHEELRAIFFDLVIHYLLFVDCQQGLSKREYYGKFILEDIQKGVFGQEIQNSITVFTIDELHIILSSIISLYQTHASLHLFKLAVRKIFKNSIIYYRREETAEVLIYLGTIKTHVTSQKINTLLTLFLPLGFAFRLYWEKHFGIIGMEQTMCIDNIVIY